MTKTFITAKGFITVVLELALLIVPTVTFAASSPMIANRAATNADTRPAHSTEPRHIVVLGYSPGDPDMQLRSIDGQSANVRLPLSESAREKLDKINSNRVWGPLLHTATYYAAYVLLSATAAYFQNAELLTVTSLVGLPILIVVSVRDLTKILTGNRLNGPYGINGPYGSWQ